MASGLVPKTRSTFLDMFCLKFFQTGQHSVSEGFSVIVLGTFQAINFKVFTAIISSDPSYSLQEAQRILRVKQTPTFLLLTISSDFPAPHEAPEHLRPWLQRALME